MDNTTKDNPEKTKCKIIKDQAISQISLPELLKVEPEELYFTDAQVISNV